MLFTLAAAAFAAITSSTVHSDAGEQARLMSTTVTIDADFPYTPTGRIWADRLPEFTDYATTVSKALHSIGQNSPLQIQVFTTSFKVGNGTYIFSAPLVGCSFSTSLQHYHMCQARFALLNDGKVELLQQTPDFPLLSVPSEAGDDSSVNDQHDFFTTLDFDANTKQLSASYTENGTAEPFDSVF